jgi:hypothetical protein
MRISIEGVVSQLMNQGFKSAVGRRRGADLTPKCKVRILSVSNASHMKVAQKPRYREVWCPTEYGSAQHSGKCGVFSP